MKAHNIRITELENKFAVFKSRLDRHSAAILDEILPALDKIDIQLNRLIVSNDRFMELERAVADIAVAVYDQRTKKADKRTTRKH
jgi:hypothetical protein